MRALRSIAPFDRRLDGTAHTVLEFFQLWASWINRIGEWDMVSGDGTTLMVIRSTATQLYVRVFPDPDEPSFIRAEIQSDAVGSHQTEGHAIMHIPEPARGSCARNEMFIRDHLTELHDLFDGVDTHDALSAPIRFWITFHGPYDSLVVCVLVNGNLSSMSIGTTEDLSLSWTRNTFNSLTGVAEYVQADLEEVTDAILGRMSCFGSYMEVNYACESLCSFKTQCQEHSEFDGSRNIDPDSVDFSNAIDVDWVNANPDGIMEVSRSLEYMVVWEDRRTGKIIEEPQQYKPRTDKDTPEEFFRAVLTTYNLQESMKYEGKAHTRRLVKIIDQAGNKVTFIKESDRFDLIDI